MLANCLVYSDVWKMWVADSVGEMGNSCGKNPHQRFLTWGNVDGECLFHAIFFHFVV